MQSTAPKTFSKEERLKSRKQILRLMSRGHRAESHPVIARYLFGTEENGKAHNKIMVVAPKKLFKNAVDRHLLKRRIREAYRLNKQILQPCSAVISFTYVSKEKLPYSKIEEAVKTILKTIAEKKPEVQAAAEPLKEEKADETRTAKKSAGFI